ncbi:hypothetical protein GTA51_18145 [Desulfovibrio aerotolerans]|uniref:SMODS-associating 2TM beta-strand rich effector domain-containing protein n=1 Tax=Solidesulfovibrio aerotolerans TaxID=295255 RepID=A0A7C9N7B2_9BACT|nr:hypothetical protein [Solidesulfovibrio aerotolerans]MYL85035.1 hypothetical protein [Solidesulfovibrio aerotolerans]
MSIERMQDAKDSTQKSVALFLICITAFKHEIFDIGHVSTSDKVVAVLFATILVVTFWFLERIVDARLDKIWIFRAIAMGADNIEGVWLDVVRDNGGIRCGALLTICYQDSQYVISGEEYFPGGGAGGAFNTDMSVYRHRKINYIYNATEADGQTSMSGRGYYEFKGFRCMQFIGKFINDNSNRHYEVRGVRLSSVLHELPPGDVRGLSDPVIRYYKKGLRRKLSRVFNQRPEMTIAEKQILTVAIIKYFERFLQCKI